MISQLIGILVIIMFILTIKILILTQNEGFESDLMLTAYPEKLTCLLEGDMKPKHVRINNTGGIMYISNRKPSESSKCRSVKCPPLFVDDLTPAKLDHYNPFPISRDNMFCHRCD